MEFETVIGLETHVQLATESKIFTSASTAFGAEPNHNIDPVTLGLPGALPVTNVKVVEWAIMLGLAMNCQIRQHSRFARKHYFYPDLPKGYQISQFEEPICERGQITIRQDEVSRTVGITRIHMEEDAGKNIHDPKNSSSLVDLNRAGVPLLEVVTEPDLRSPGEAAAYMRTVRQLVRWLGISDGNMEEGSLRCDANVSIRPMGEMKFGTRTEIKNLNSFRFVEQALEYEVVRQIKMLKNGEKVEQQTLLFDPDRGTTHPMRGKEESSDYRYFPDPDLPPLVIEESLIRQIQNEMPPLPEERYADLIESHRLSSYDAGVLTSEREVVDYYDKVVEHCGNPKSAGNWVTSELFGQLKKREIDFSECSVSAERLGQLLKLVEDGVLSGKMAKDVFEDLFETNKSPEEIVEEKGLKQVTDEGAITAEVLAVIEANPEQVANYLGGNEKLLGFFVGQVMKSTGGTANPKMVNEVLKAELEKKR